jgi:hypothetical protein
VISLALLCRAGRALANLGMFALFLLVLLLRRVWRWL